MKIFYLIIIQRICKAVVDILKFWSKISFEINNINSVIYGFKFIVT